MATQADIQTQLPLTEATFFILLSLAPGPKHGYGIMKDVQALSKDRVVLSTGTLYGALKRLLEQGWIEHVEETDPAQPASSGTGRPRKAYALTHLGRRILNAEVSRLRELVAAAHPRTAEGRV